MKKIVFICVLVLTLLQLKYTKAQTPSFKLGLLKYRGGGDWYANPTSIKNLVAFCNTNLGMNLATEQGEVEPASPELFNYSFLHTTGHGNIQFNSEEAQNMRQWLLAGGFWHIDDNYGMDKYARDVIKQVFPEIDLITVPFSHPIYNISFPFAAGLPKVHEHDNKPPVGYGIMFEGRLVIFYTAECDLGDGWEDAEVHNDPEEKRTAALRMGANLVTYSCLF